MGQYWKLINLDKRETYGFWGKLGECLFDGSPACLNQSLRIPPPLPECDRLLIPFKPALLVNLPVALIQEICYELENIRDIICLSLTCQSLWEVGRQEIYRRLTLLISAVSWAGDRIICVGDYLQNDDIPDHILTSAEKEFSDQKPAPDEDDDEFEYPEQHYTLCNYPSRELPYGHADFNMSEFIIRSKLSYHLCDVFLPMVNLPYTTSQPIKPEASAILRNLSRCQYVRESALGPWHARWGKAGFGEIVLSRICCSSDPPASMAYEGNIHRGVWAGDRLDIVSSEWLEGLDNGDDGLWTDISEEVLEEISLI